MKKISYANDFNEVKSLFDKARSGQMDVILWQKTPEYRFVRFTRIEKNLFDQKTVWLKAKSDTAVEFKRSDIYCFIEELQLIFKSSVTEIDSNLVAVDYPEEATLLEAEDPALKEYTLIKGRGEGNFRDVMRVKGGKSEPINDRMVIKSMAGSATPETKIEDEAQFAAMRESQRVKPKEEKYVSVIRDNGEVKEPQTYQLLDLSQGGAGLLIFSETEFSLKEPVSIVAIDGKPIDKVLKGEIVAIRPHNPEKSEFKAGIKFFT
jgi:hypothetical protein